MDGWMLNRWTRVLDDAPAADMVERGWCSMNEQPAITGAASLALTPSQLGAVLHYYLFSLELYNGEDQPVQLRG